MRSHVQEIKPNPPEKCTWKFVADDNVGDVEVLCDHVDIAGNFFAGCSGDGGFLSAKMVQDEWDTDVHDGDTDKVCGDLSAWIPLVKKFPAPKDRQSRKRMPKV